MLCIGRIPPNTSHEARIYPLPHTYVVKDLVPDLTQFYKQYKSIKPYLQRSTKTEDVRFPSQNKSLPPLSPHFTPINPKQTNPLPQTGPRKPPIPL